MSFLKPGGSVGFFFSLVFCCCFFFKANVGLLKLKRYVSKQSNMFLTHSITSSFTLFKNGPRFHTMSFQQFRESFLSHRFFTEPKTTDFKGKKRTNHSRNLFKRNHKKKHHLERSLSNSCTVQKGNKKLSKT